MKRLLSSLAAIALILMPAMATVPAIPAYAQAGLPALCTGFQLQNPDPTTDATINLQFYAVGDASPGTADYVTGVSVAHNGSQAFYVPSAFSTMPSGSYGLVVQSSVSLNALSNQVDCATGGLNVGASTRGINAADTATTVYLPFVLSRAYAAVWSSFLAIQNAGTATATNVKIEFYKSGQSTPVTSFTNNSLAVGETWTLDLSQGTYATAALSGFSGAAKITSDQAVAAVALYATGDGSRLLSYNGVTAGSQTLFATQVNRKYAAGQYNAGITLYNLGATDTPIQIDFYAVNASTPLYTMNTTISGSSSFIFYMGPGSALDSVGAMNPSFNGSAKVTVTSGSNQIVGIFNMDSAAGAADAADMARLEDGTTKLMYPQIVRTLGGAGYESGWQVVNTTGTAATLNIHYVGMAAGVAKNFDDLNVTLDPYATKSVYVGGGAFASALGTGWNGSVVIDASQPIVGQANFVAMGAGAKDSLLLYNGFRGN